MPDEVTEAKVELIQAEADLAKAVVESEEEKLEQAEIDAIEMVAEAEVETEEELEAHESWDESEHAWLQAEINRLEAKLSETHTVLMGLNLNSQMEGFLAGLKIHLSPPTPQHSSTVEIPSPPASLEPPGEVKQETEKESEPKQLTKRRMRRI